MHLWICVWTTLIAGCVYFGVEFSWIESNWASFCFFICFFLLCVVYSHSPRMSMYAYTYACMHEWHIPHGARHAVTTRLLYVCYSMCFNIVLYILYIAMIVATSTEYVHTYILLPRLHEHIVYIHFVYAMYFTLFLWVVQHLYIFIFLFAFLLFLCSTNIYVQTCTLLYNTHILYSIQVKWTKRKSKKKTQYQIRF